MTMIFFEITLLLMIQETLTSQIWEILVCGSGFITNLSSNWQVVYLWFTIASLIFQKFQSQLATCKSSSKPSSWAFMLEFMLYSSWSLSMCRNWSRSWSSITDMLHQHLYKPSQSIFGLSLFSAITTSHCVSGCSPKLTLQGLTFAHHGNKALHLELDQLQAHWQYARAQVHHISPYLYWK